MQRDLGSSDLWDASLQRSRHRRELAELTRKHAPRRKGASVALSAAVVAAPAAPAVAATVGHSGDAATPGAVDRTPDASVAAPILLKPGATGPMVTRLQQAVNVTVDGFYGPQTRGGVVRAQRSLGLPATGVVDLKTWIALVHPKVSVDVRGAGIGSTSGDRRNAVLTAAPKARVASGIPASSS